MSEHLATDRELKAAYLRRQAGWLKRYVRVLARALCDSSSHMNLLPRAEQRPCEYHLKRAADTVTAFAKLCEAEHGR